MGLYFNKNNDSFKNDLDNDIYVDKSLLISITNNKLNKSNDKFICVTRPRRFGKSMGLNMLNAYYSKGCDSKELFNNLKISNDPSFLNHLNKHNVIYINIIDIFNKVDNDLNFMKLLNEKVICELKETYNFLDNINNIGDALGVIYIKTNEKFIFLIDEWDYPFTRASKDVVDVYMKMLSGLFKGETSYLELAYMTGVLPIKKYSATSDLNNFKEYSMLEPKQLAPFFGFTDSEVKELCSKYNMDYNKMKEWYDGYKLGDYEIYNPLSVVSAIENNEFGDYWNSTSSVDAVISYMQNRDYSLKTELVELISGEKTSCNITSFNGE